MIQKNRISGGLVNRTQVKGFTFNGRTYEGFAGDTLASALLANGEKLVGRSFKYHRPRGIFSSGSEEPNGLVQLGQDAECEPNTRATTLELFDGLFAESQNHRGSLNYDLLAVNDLFSSLLSAGFYYKTFMWPKSFWEKIYEPLIRNAAGLGRLPGKADTAKYDKGFLHCDVLVIGAGPAGLSAALQAARSGARVILADEDFLLGGRLNSETLAINNEPGRLWADKVVSELRSFPNIRILNRTTVFGVYDHGVYGALETITKNSASSDATRQILWRIYSKSSILCAGAIERSIAFGNNDRPGIMLAGAVRAYANRYAVATGKSVALFTNNDNGWRTARDLLSKGVNVEAVIDTRQKGNAAISGVATFFEQSVVNTTGRKGVRQIKLSNGTKIAVDCLGVSGGWNPNVHLTCHHRGRPVWNNDIAAFVPGRDLPPGMVVAGAAMGAFTLAEALVNGNRTAAELVERLGFKSTSVEPVVAEDDRASLKAYWEVPNVKNRAWIDLQNDVTAKDIRLADQEGFSSVEHLKRYTTLGMATDQGKTSNVLGLAILADATGRTIPETGTTIFRPPYNPVPIAAFAGRSKGSHFRPTRLPPSHKWAEEQGAVFNEVGAWLRAQWFPQPGEKHWRQSVDREVTMTRQSVGVCDVTTLGKIDVQGRDAAQFLNRVYANGFAKLAVGKTRYGLMLREDGIAFDDGTTARLADTHYVMTTTTANALPVLRHMEFARQCLWPNMDVHLVSTTDAWAQYAVAGPNSRSLLAKIVDAPFDISNEGFPFMACAELTICGGIPARLFRISFSGELAYEIAVQTNYGDDLIRVLMAAGEEFDIVPYGTEALGVMRIEKGHVAGSELDGRTTAQDLGLGGFVSRKKDCIGNTLSERSYLARTDRCELVGLKPVDNDHDLTAGAHFIEINAEPTTENDLGWMSSVAFSPSLGHAIGLGFVKSGTARHGDIILATDLVREVNVNVEIVSPHFVDPKGERLRG